jgi:hypothetical protein
MPRRKNHTIAAAAGSLFERADASLLDLIDNVLDKGVVLNGEVILGLAQVDLVYVRLSAVLCATDRMFPAKDPP